MFGEKVYRQTKGIPMGTNRAGFLANLYLLSYELGFLKQLRDHIQKGNGNTATPHERHMAYIATGLFLDFTFFGRYIDDLFVIANRHFWI